MKLFQCALVAISLTLCSDAQSVLFAYDSAADSSYDSGFVQYSTGGFGFDVWDYGISNSTHPSPMFMGTSNGNGTGAGPGIDTGGRAWGMSYPTIGSSYLYRFLTNAMPTAATYSCLWDTGFLADTGTSYETNMYSDTIAFFQVSIGQFAPITNYRVQFSEVLGPIDTGIAWTDGGLKVSFTLLAANGSEFDYLFQLTALSTSQTYSYSGTTFGAAGSAPSLVDFWAKRARSAPAGDYFVNEMKIESVPEPATMAVLGLGAATLLRRRRK